LRGKFQLLPFSYRVAGSGIPSFSRVSSRKFRNVRVED